MNRGKCESFLGGYQLLELAKDPAVLIGPPPPAAAAAAAASLRWQMPMAQARFAQT